MRTSIRWLSSALLLIFATSAFAYLGQNVGDGFFSPSNTEVETANVNIAPLAVETNSAVFINEFHYDNDSTDTGEFVEVAGIAGTDLTQWSVVFYNGSNGTVYRTETLSGILTDAGDGVGFAVIDLPSNGIQNGAPDGIALVDSNNGVAQFLSYEGSFTAVGGAADGLQSTDIGVAETSSTPVGFSLQLTGTGCSVEAFTWSAPATETKGAANNNQTFDCETTDPEVTPEPTEPPTETETTVFINEIHYDNTGGDVGEFFEVAGPAGTDLAGWTMALYNGSNGTVYNTINLAGVFTDESGGYGFIDFQLPANGLQNGSPDGLALVNPDSEVIQFLSYEGVVDATTGPANGTSSTDIGVSEPGSTPIGQSLQLTGTGCEYEDFTWTGPIDETPG
ncbi:MAG: hypothetical protein AAFV93_14315, partial [Chloroflexota bacterium]